ncbi:MAG: DUF3422 domain-containing protein [Pseudomonadota bacterium]
MSKASTQTVSKEDRIKLSSEWHARPNISLPHPFRCTHIVGLRDSGSDAEAWEAISEFCELHGQSGPAAGSRYHVVETGSCLLKWECHTEATSHTLLVPGSAQPPFSETALDFLDEAKREDLLANMFVGVHVEVLPAPSNDDPSGYEMACALLGARPVYGGEMSDKNAVVWSAFRLDAAGFIRLVIIDRGISGHRLSRLLQRLLDMETYRMLAIRALPAARSVMSTVQELEPQIGALMKEMAERGTIESREHALDGITEIASRIEEIATSHSSSFSAARAYSRMVERRIEEVGETVVDGQQRYTNFLLRALSPAMRTCEAAERRVSELAERVARSANLLSTMVNLQQSRSSQGVLKSMADSSQRQLLLQQAVEGFSIFAISYYAVGLLKYFLDSLYASGLGVDSKLLVGWSAPLVFGLVFISVRMVRRRLTAQREEK